MLYVGSDADELMLIVVDIAVKNKTDWPDSSFDPITPSYPTVRVHSLLTAFEGDGNLKRRRNVFVKIVL